MVDCWEGGEEGGRGVGRSSGLVDVGRLGMVAGGWMVGPLGG